MQNGSKFRLEDVSIFLNGDHLHVIGSGEDETLVSLYDIADELFNQPINDPSLIPKVIIGLHNVITYIEDKQNIKRTLN
tara:strand:- start:474 stop:710 length:237 start_codon:yes stop_codon:yes gene_type:complete